MQRLHLVGLTEDADGLIFSTRRGAKSGGFVVSVDPSLLAALAEAGGNSSSAGTAKAPRSNGRAAHAAPRPGGRPESQLSPREMQELLRAGWTLEEVAVEAGVDVDWVSRFAAPVMAEIQRVVDQAVASVFDKPRAGASALALGPSVRRNLAERGVRLTDEDFADGWSAHQLDELTWVVTFTYTSRGRPQEAAWAIDLEADELVARNRLGTALGHVTSIRRKVSTAPPPKPKPPASAVKRAASSTRSAPAPAATRRRPAAPPAKARATKKAAKATKSSKATKKRAGAAKRGKRPAPAVAAVDVEVLEVAPPPLRPNTTSDVYRTELRRRLAIEAADRPRPRPPTPEPELSAPRAVEAVVRGPMPAPAPVPVPAAVRDKVGEPIGTFDIEHDHKDDLDDSPFAAEAWYPKPAAPRPPEPEAHRSPPAARPPETTAGPGASPQPAGVRLPQVASLGVEPAGQPETTSGSVEPRPGIHPPDSPTRPAEPSPAPQRPEPPLAVPSVTSARRAPLRPDPASVRDPAPEPPEPPVTPTLPAPEPPGAPTRRLERILVAPANRRAPAATLPPPQPQPSVPVFHGATAAAEAPRPPRRREPLRAR